MGALSHQPIPKTIKDHRDVQISKRDYKEPRSPSDLRAVNLS